MKPRCDTCNGPVDDTGRVTRRYTLGSKRPSRVIAATCAACLAADGGGLRDGQAGTCKRCRGRIYWSRPARRWLHDDTPWFAPHPAEATERTR